MRARWLAVVVGVLLAGITVPAQAANIRTGSSRTATRRTSTPYRRPPLSSGSRSAPREPDEGLWITDPALWVRAGMKEA